MVQILAAVFIFAGCPATSPPPPATKSHTEAFKQGVPGGIIVNTVEVSAKVTGIDPGNRKVTLLMSDGNKTTVKVRPEAVNFDQIRKDDLVKVTLTEELVVYLDKEGASSPDGTAGIVALAPKGAQPGGVMAETTQVTATVAAIDPAGRTATLLFDDGSSKAFPVRDDIDLSRHKIGEKVVFLVTEMIAVSVEKQ
jgi:translation elongation factor P/translation initiation factor 5A